MISRAEVPEWFNVTSYFLDRAVLAGRGDRIALRGEEGDTDYAALAALTNRIGNVLRELGLRRGDRILLAVDDSVEFVATWYAAQKIGVVTAEVYSFLRPKDYAYYLDYTRAAVVVADQVTIAAIREAAPASEHLRHILVLGGDGATGLERPFEELVAQASDELDPEPVGRDEVAIWKFTTGSTGSPKACVHTPVSPAVSFHAYGLGVLGLTEDDVVLPVPKLFFGYSRDLTALFPFGVGGAGIVFPQRSTPERMFELIARFRPTILVNVPTMMSAMLAHPSAAEQDLSCLRLCTSAGEALPAELHRKWDTVFGVPVVDGIGSSEAYHIYVSNRPGQSRAGSMGQVVPGYRARVVDADRAPLPDGEVGVLEVTGPTTALGYVGDAERSAATFHDDTVHTGDLVVRDEDGYFYYRGRADDLLKVGGIWVAPSEIEHCLIGHPDVVECAVVGYTADGLVRPRAYVVLRDGANATEPQLQDYARSLLAAHKYPRQVRFVDALPRTANGKLDRTALRRIDEVAP